MKLIGRIIWEAADRSEYYPLIWDPTLSIALLPGGACTVRQGGNAYAFQGVTTPVAYTDAPGVAAASLDTLASAIHALPVPADNSAALAAIQIAVSAVQGSVGKLAIPPDVTPLLKALQASVATLPTVAAIKSAVVAGAGSLGPTALTQTDGTGGQLLILWLQGNATDTAPTLTYNGKPIAAVPVLSLAP